MSTKKYNVKKQKRKSFTRSKNKRRSKRTKKFKVKRKLSIMGIHLTYMK